MVTQPKTLRFTGRAVKATVVVDGATLIGIAVPFGVGHVPFRIDVSGRTIRGRLAAKGVRRATAALGDRPGDFAVVVTGQLHGDELEQAGLVVAEKAKPTAAAVGTG